MIVGGSHRVPGDKSLTHRALFLSALTRGESSVEGALTSLDASSTASFLRGLGVKVSPLRVGKRVRIRAPRTLIAPSGVMDCGNSGTTARLGMGLLAAQPFAATLDGDESLRRRPMLRVAEPLRAMGASVSTPEGDGLPVFIRGGGGTLVSIEWELPVSSAQLKGAILLAAVAGRVDARLREPAGRSRDHTERLLRAHGYTVDEGEDGWITFRPDGDLLAGSFHVPGDISSASFLVGAATLAEGGEIRIEQVGMNPTRTGFLEVLRRMGGAVEKEAPTEWTGEPVADLVVRPADLQATEVAPLEIPGLIDEVPLLAVLASRAEGTTIFHEVGELRVKESDRLSLIADNLRALGADATAEQNTLWVTGTDGPAAGRVITAGDHRIAMAFAVLGRLPGAAVEIDDMQCTEISFPRFPEALDALTQAGKDGNKTPAWGRAAS